jgi:hypothetical protein
VGKYIEKIFDLVAANAKIQAFFYVLKQLLCGKISSLRLLILIYKLRVLSFPTPGIAILPTYFEERITYIFPFGDSQFGKVNFSTNGFYHNVVISKHFKLYDIGGLRWNCPIREPGMSQIFVSVLEKYLDEFNFTDQSIVDIGPAEGYFSFFAARNGAQVTAIEGSRDNLFKERLHLLRDYFRLNDKITVIEGSFPEVGREEIMAADIIMCLGLLYHLEDVTPGLSFLVESGADIIIECLFFKDQFYIPENLNEKGHIKIFNPETHQDNEPLCTQWFVDFLRSHGYDVIWMPEWQKYVEQPNLLNHEQTRKALIAVPARNN